MKLRTALLGIILVSGSIGVACSGDDDSASNAGGSAGKPTAGTSGEAGENSTGGKGTGGTAGKSTGGTSNGGRATGGTAGKSEAGASGANEAGAGAGENGGAGNSEAGASGASEGGGAGTGNFDCSLPNASGAPTITASHASGDPPNMTGGTVRDGTYFQTTEDDYHTETAEGVAHRVVVIDQAGGRFAEVVTNDSGAVQEALSLVGPLTVTSPGFNVSGSACEHNEDVLTIQYKATSSTLTWVDPGHPDRVFTFERQ